MLDLEVFKKYARKVNADDDDLNSMFVDSAKLIVQKYLGYDYTNEDLIEESFTINYACDKIVVDNYIGVLSSVEVNGTAVTGCRTQKNIIIFPAQLALGDEVEVSYETGLADVALIDLTVYRIASLLATESDGNIGVTSTSFADTSRSFVNYVNYSKYLDQIEQYRIIL